VQKASQSHSGEGPPSPCQGLVHWDLSRLESLNRSPVTGLVLTRMPMIDSCEVVSFYLISVCDGPTMWSVSSALKNRHSIISRPCPSYAASLVRKSGLFYGFPSPRPSARGGATTCRRFFWSDKPRYTLSVLRLQDDVISPLSLARLTAEVTVFARLGGSVFSWLSIVLPTPIRSKFPHFR
jgi:hypothetical protein